MRVGKRAKYDPNIPEDDPKRQQMLVQFIIWLGDRGISYIPLDIMEDINDSYADDPMDVFRANLNGWARELVKGT